MVAELDGDLPLHQGAPLAAHIAATGSMERLFTTLFAVFGATGLLRADVGLYALMVFSVVRRTRELGIRAALGAGPRKVVWAGVRAAWTRLAFGVGLGLGSAAVVAVFMGYDPGTSPPTPRWPSCSG